MKLPADINTTIISAFYLPENILYINLSTKNLIQTSNNPYLIYLGFQPYYSDNVVKLYDPKYPVRIRLQFKGKLKRYKITQPYNYTIQQNTEIKTNNFENIEDAFEKQYKYKSNKQDFYNFP